MRRVNSWSGLALLVLVLLRPAAGAKAPPSFTGTWDTNYGPLTMIQKARKVTGSYYDNKAKLEGIIEKGHLRFTYREKGEQGEGEFKLSPDGKTFRGKYRVRGTKEWKEWNGTRK